MKKVRYRITVKGRVQGVGYRWNAAAEARIRGIKGCVRNMPDGSVYIEAEAGREILDSFIDWCRKGPRLSIVEEVEVTKSDPLNYSDFSIVS